MADDKVEVGPDKEDRIDRGRDLERKVKVSAPYDSAVEAEVVLESVPVWFDLGWQKVDGEDYGDFAELAPAAADSSPSTDLQVNVAPETQGGPSLPRTARSQGASPTQP